MIDQIRGWLGRNRNLILRMVNSGDLQINFGWVTFLSREFFTQLIIVFVLLLFLASLLKFHLPLSSEKILTGKIWLSRKIAVLFSKKYFWTLWSFLFSGIVLELICFCNLRVSSGTHFCSMVMSVLSFRMETVRISASFFQCAFNYFAENGERAFSTTLVIESSSISCV